MTEQDVTAPHAGALSLERHSAAADQAHLAPHQPALCDVSPEIGANVGV